MAAGAEAAHRESGHEGHHRLGVLRGVGDRERLHLVGREAAPGRVLELAVPRGVEVQLELGQLVQPIGPAAHDLLHRGRDLGHRVGGAAQFGGDRCEPLHLLVYVEQEALAQELRLAREVVGERAERDAGRARHPAVAHRGDAVLADQAQRRVEDAVAGGALFIEGSHARWKPTLYRSFERTTWPPPPLNLSLIRSMPAPSLPSPACADRPNCSQRAAPPRASSSSSRSSESPPRATRWARSAAYAPRRRAARRTRPTAAWRAATSARRSLACRSRSRTTW